ncbi:MAG: ubiquitin-like small modifier protein 1 [Microthrixaceae bacterium]|jgi:molybdopterin converting factor small subunit
MITIRIPTTLRTLTAGESEVQVEGATVAEALANLEAAHPGFRERLFDDEGALRRFVNVFVADDDVRYLDGVDTAVAEGGEISIIPAVAGG